MPLICARSRMTCSTQSAESCFESTAPAPRHRPGARRATPNCRIRRPAMGSLSQYSPIDKPIIDCYIRNSTVLQRDNWRAERQHEVLPALAEAAGFAWMIHDEQGTSGETLAK